MNLCECGCGQLVKKRFVSGHNLKGQSSWCKGLTKETDLRVKAQADKMRGRTKETDEGIKQRTESNKRKFVSGELTIWNKGKTKETDASCKVASERMLKFNPMFNNASINKMKTTIKKLNEKGEINHNKGKSLEELHGKEKADEIRKKIGKVTDGKTYEELYGVGKAKEVKSKIGIKSKIYMSGKTLKERLGIEKAQEIKEKLVKSHLGIYQTLESKNKIGETLRKKYESGERKSANLGKIKETSESVKRHSEKMREGYKSGKIKVWNKGLTIEDERVKSCAEGFKKFIEEHGSPLKGRTKETHEYIRNHSEWMKKFLSLPENKLLWSENAKKMWRNPEFKEKTIKACLKGLLKKPTSYEKRIIELCEKYSLSYKYVGNGKLLIGFKNPDFVNINGCKIVLEIYAIGHLGNLKPLNYEEKRTKHFSDYGYKVIFFTEKDLFREDWQEHCKQRIAEVESEDKGYQTNSV